jgi:prevent-host-death family protein
MHHTLTVGAAIMSTVTTFTGQEFNRNVSGAKSAADKGPVIITDRGEPSYVLISIAEYRALSQRGRKLSELLAMPGGDAIQFEPSKGGLALQIPDLGA